ncbi:hypothetical protein C3747_7g505 [Trypanosoma cruzi]|uniref:Uncharacterized protein n=2 Tax=Trypanosoma cruzi TaxID=5693 RepID=Q4DPX1_TRYCC|nr:hypothetical protein, conserved [Trypanosoma cruzi]EAN94574.1 hypothetical protein, conserved [Trypanosoma cruzi]PWV20085.1 hypothetical protein C3747_7g505 [Trypanosoma cruzi]RNC46808.1 hypothetical protein TcCL_NonESM03410 [Trypanosoma cruzi]|eukprot:XP_816425.1 hypothetical protein [Trypanosoma cruzi strain CL Brener]
MLTAAVPPPTQPPPVEKFPVPTGTTRVTAGSSYPSQLPASVPIPQKKSSVSLPTAAFVAQQTQGPTLATTTAAPVLKSQFTQPLVVPVVATSAPTLEVLPTCIPVVPSVLWYNKQIQHISAKPSCGAVSEAVSSLRVRHSDEHRASPSMYPPKNRYLWQPAPLSENIASESWRGTYWKYVDVHRYIARRYCGNPPPKE